MTTVILRGALARQHVATRENLQSWESSEWRLAADRASAESIAVEVTESDVIELELEDGTSVLLVEDQLESYGFRRSRSGEGGIEIGPYLQPEGAEATRGLGRLALGALRLWRNPAGDLMQVLAGAAEDAQLGRRRGWYRFEAGASPGKKLEAIDSSSDPTLLLIHGTISSCPGSFGGLLDGAAWHRLRAQYGERIYGFEHRTLTESPLDNALALLEGLPAGQVVDLVTHSRGGLVAELLIRASDRSGAHFSSEHIAAFRRAVDPSVAITFGDQLERLQDEAARKRLTIRRIVRAAAPMRGTTIMSGRLDRWTSAALNTLKWSLRLAGHEGAAEVADSVKAFLLELTRQRTVPTVLPGLESMRPESPWITLLNPPPNVRVTTPTFVVAGDYRGQGAMRWLADRFSDSFYGGANDWVVNTASMTGGATRDSGIRRVLYHDADTIHTTYFNRDIVRARVLAALERGVEAEGFELVQREASAIARGGRKTKAKPGAPIALLLPGISGSHLQVGTNRIWLQFHEVIAGNLRKLDIAASNVSPDGWIDSAYEAFAEFLSKTHEVRPFAYDWRLSIASTGEAFAAVLKVALDDAAQRKQPVHIFAHSLGGLVARFALGLDGLWDHLQDRTGCRLILFGTPNNGSHSIPWLLMGRERTVRMLARLDTRHGRRGLVDLFRQLPGVLQLMPFGDWADRNYFDSSFWAEVGSALGGGNGWPVPDTATLDECAQVLKRITTSPLGGRPVVYVAGYDPKRGTIANLPKLDGGYEAKPIHQGDGRVLWSSGIPAGVATYFVDAVHGDLVCHRPAFEGYLELATRGSTARLSSTPPVALDGRDPVGRDRGADVLEEAALLYPTEAELVAAALGARPPLEDGADEGSLPSVEVRLVHGSFVTARGPIVIGRYENDVELRGTLKVLDGLLGGLLEDALTLDCLPSSLGEVHVTPLAPGSNLGAVVVGLGRLGDLTPGGLQDALARALLELVLRHSPPAREQQPTIDVCSVLVGSGDFGLAIEGAIFALLQAVRRVQSSVTRRRGNAGRSLPRLGRITLFEIDEVRAERLAAALTRLLGDEKLGIDFDHRIAAGDDGLRSYLPHAAGAPSTQRVVIRAPRGVEGGFEFTAISRSARSDFAREPAQGQFVRRMLALATGSTMDQPGLSRALYELITPNAYKPVLGNVDGLVLNVDEAAAAMPWELMRDPHESGEPLATRIPLIRQLVRSPRQSAVRSPVRRALVIGDTAAGERYGRLEGARAEMRAVRGKLAGGNLEVDAYEGIEALDLLSTLLLEEHGILHIAAHGDWLSIDEDGVVASGSSPRVERVLGAQLERASPTGERISGVVLGDGLLLTSRQIAKLPRVPELVFLNCCHLGDTSRDTVPSGAPWPELAASLAIAFIDRGAKVVVAAGWAVDDAAAETFASSFYEQLLRGSDLGAAVLFARRSTWNRHRSRNTWGAYQAYGDDKYKLPRHGDRRPGPSTIDQPQITTRLAALDAIQELIGRVQYQQKLASSFPEVERAEPDPEEVARRMAPSILDDAEVRAGVARAFQVAGQRSKAITHYEAAVALGTASLAVRDVEQLANLETRHATATLESLWAQWRASAVPDKPQAVPATTVQPWRGMLDRGRSRLEKLDQALPPTIERLGLLGSAWKRTAWFDSIQSQIGIDKPLPDPIKALQKSIKAYRRAVTMSRQATDDADHYPANNLAQLYWLEGIVSATPSKAFKSTRVLAGAALANARRRSQDGGDFWDHAAEIDCALSLALADELDQARSEIGPDEIAERLTRALNVARRALRRRFGNDYRTASPGEQLQFLIAMLRWKAWLDDQSDGLASVYATALETLRSAVAEPLRGDSETGPGI